MAEKKGSNEALSVGDLYCGAGGFAEGFRQAGFDVRWAIDNWAPAVETFRRNQPGTDVIQADVMSINASDLDPVDVVIGSPPCTYFSAANRGGSGDKNEGLRLVKRFFEVVKDLDPTYWIMENVPPLHGTLLHELDGDIMSLANGNLQVPHLKILVASEYGVPQGRRRLFSGKYPLPRPSDGRQPAATTLKSVLTALPDPCSGGPNPRRVYSDPLYPGLKSPEASLTDHFDDQRFRLTREELGLCKSQKLEHHYYGKMEWPDELDRPSRTITATRTKTSRSTIVIRCPHHEGRRAPLRSLTLRECASVQGFPTTYQFWADSLTAREWMVGNAVAPILARSLAHAILDAEGIPIPLAPRIQVPGVRSPPVTMAPKRKFRYSERRRFRRFARVDWKPECRAQLENVITIHGKAGDGSIAFSTSWMARLYIGYAKDYRCYEVPFERAEELLQSATGPPGQTESVPTSMEKLLKNASALFEGLPDGDALQLRWSGRQETGPSPEDVIRDVERMVHAHIRKRLWNQIKVPREAISKLLDPPVSRGRDADGAPPIDLPGRTLAALVVLSLACAAVRSAGGARPGRRTPWWRSE